MGGAAGDRWISFRWFSATTLQRYIAGSNHRRPEQPVSVLEDRGRSGACAAVRQSPADRAPGMEADRRAKNRPGKGRKVSGRGPDKEGIAGSLVRRPAEAARAQAGRLHLDDVQLRHPRERASQPLRISEVEGVEARGRANS